MAARAGGLMFWVCAISAASAAVAEEKGDICSETCAADAPAITDAMANVKELTVGFFGDVSAEEEEDEAGDDNDMEDQRLSSLNLNKRTPDPVPLGDGKTWLIVVYTPFCEWSTKLASVWAEIGSTAGPRSKSLKIGKFDGTQHGAGGVHLRYGIRTFPTILLVLPDGRFREYMGPRNVPSVANFIKRETANSVDLFPAVDPLAPPVPGRVYPINNDNYDIIRSPSHNVFVKVFAPWCGHCKAMEDAYIELAGRYKNRKDVVIAELDGQKYKTAAEAEGMVVGGFPTIALYPKGGQTRVYTASDRSADKLQEFLEKHMA